MEGVGLTVIVKVVGTPLHPTLLLRNCGVTVTVAVTTFVVLFKAVNDAMFPIPEAANPIEVVLFVQLYTFAFPVNVTVDVAVFWHNTWFAAADIVGAGFTVISYVTPPPGHATAPPVDTFTVN